MNTNTSHANRAIAQPEPRTDLQTDGRTGTPTDGRGAMSAETEMEWMLHAKCRGVAPTAFFPSDGVGVERAQRVCENCPVRMECLEYALEHRIEHGVWGGTSERERRRIARRRRQPGDIASFSPTGQLVTTSS